MSRPKHAITFDVGGTLIEPWPSVGAVYAEVAAEHGFGGLPAETLTRRFSAAWHAAREFDYTKPGWARLVDATFDGLVPVPPSRTFFGALYGRFAEPSAWRVFDDVRPALERLRRAGVVLGVISNWDARLRPLLSRLELSGYFTCIVVSCEAGCAKPAPEIFARAARQLELPPQAMLHVGDSETADVRGAQAAGMSARLLRRGAIRPQPPILASLHELAAPGGRLAGSA